MEGKPHLLIESVAETIAQKVLNGYPTVDSIQISVEKPHVAVSGVLESLGIEITRRRKYHYFLKVHNK